MNYFLYEFLLILIFIKVKTKETTPVIIPFETTNRKDLNPDNYFDLLFNNEVK